MPPEVSIDQGAGSTSRRGYDHTKPAVYPITVITAAFGAENMFDSPSGRLDHEQVELRRGVGLARQQARLTRRQEA